MKKCSNQDIKKAPDLKKVGFDLKKLPPRSSKVDTIKKVYLIFESNSNRSD